MDTVASDRPGFRELGILPRSRPHANSLLDAVKSYKVALGTDSPQLLFERAGRGPEGRSQTRRPPFALAGERALLLGRLAEKPAPRLIA